MLTPLQNRLLKMLDWFHNYCAENGYTYYIVGGSMLGAVRHGGFIPWDDDVDIAVPRPQYDRLIRSFTDTLDGYRLESPYTGAEDYLYTFAKLYDTSTTMIEKCRYKTKRGVYIDIFPLDGVGTSEADVRRNFKKIDRMNMFLMARTCCIDKDRSLYKNIAVILARAVPRFIINDKKLSIKIDRLAASFDYERSNYVANLMGSYRSKEIVRKEVFGIAAKYQFENITVYGVEHYDEFLTHIYNDWGQLPPEEKRKTRHDFLLLDFSKSYLNQ